MNSFFQNTYVKLIFALLTAALFVNIAVIDLLFYKNMGFQDFVFQKPQQSSQNASVLQNNNYCDQNCVDKIYETIKQATQTATTLTPSVPQTAQNGQSLVKEYYVTFGSGTNSTNDWADVTGLSVYADSTAYGSIKQAVFEATISIPTGNETAYARLYNETDKHPVWFSDVSLSGGTPQLLISKPITLDSWNKLYQVQMKTDLSYPANITQARIHLTVK